MTALAGMANCILTIGNLKKHFGSLPVLRGVSLDVKPGEVVFIIGPSGSGKSTLLRCINFLERPDAGSIHFGGKAYCEGEGKAFRLAPERDIRQMRSRVPIVFQHFNLFKHMTVLENIIEGPVSVLRRPRPQAVEDARRVLATVGLTDKLYSYPAQLSGGQQQRVGIARALAMNPEMILFDEPTSALDPELVSGILETIRALADAGMTMVIVTHEMSFARRLGDTIYFMDRGEIVESGAPSDVFGKADSGRLRSFLHLLDK
jgi:ABC-type polar amino acid transport system ATPase subunit